jgi:hypothetical protein
MWQTNGHKDRGRREGNDDSLHERLQVRRGKRKPSNCQVAAGQTAQPWGESQPQKLHGKIASDNGATEYGYDGYTISRNSFKSLGAINHNHRHRAEFAVARDQPVLFPTGRSTHYKY